MLKQKREERKKINRGFEENEDEKAKKEGRNNNRFILNSSVNSTMGHVT